MYFRRLALSYSSYVSAFDEILLSFAPVFTAPTFQSFLTIAHGWILCMGRPTVSRIIKAAGAKAVKSLRSYLRFFSKSRWLLDELSRLLVVKLIVPLLIPDGPIDVAFDDSTCGKTGKKVAAAGWFHDASLSNVAKTVVHWAHNWVILSLQIKLPLWPNRVLSLPVMFRLYRKEKDCSPQHPFKTRHELATDMLCCLRNWLPGRHLRCVGDGAYASKEIVERLPEHLPLVSRVRRDASLYSLPPAVAKRKRGRPRTKGNPLPKLPEIAKTAEFAKAKVVMYGELRDWLAYSFVCLWPQVAGQKPVRVVISRDPNGKQKDDFLFSTDPGMEEKAIIEVFAARWPIEESIREAKQLLGFEDVQGWSPVTVERQAPMALILLSVVKLWFTGLELSQHKGAAPGCAAAWQADNQQMAAFSTMLRRLRLALWHERISSISSRPNETKKILSLLDQALAAAG